MVSYGTTTIAAAPAVAGYGMPTMTTAAAPAMTSYAAPAMTSYAAPAMTNYAAAPAMTSYAAPAMTNYAAAPAMTSYAAPAMTSYAGPAMANYAAAPAMTSYAAPAMTTMAPSFVAPPAAAMMTAMPEMVMPQAAMAPPALPVRLTEGIPTPEQILAQKNGYSMALDKQLKQATDTVIQENAIEKEMVKFSAAKNIALYEMQVDEQLVEALALTDEQGTIAHCELKKALVERNLQLNGQASNLLMDYQMKALVTECEMKKYAFAQQYAKKETELAGQMVQQEMKAATGTAYAAPAQAVV